MSLSTGASTLAPSSSTGQASLRPQRLGSIPRSHTAPNKMAVNGHMASVGKAANGINGTGSFENGVQVIDEDKEFKYVRFKKIHPTQ